MPVVLFASTLHAERFFGKFLTEITLVPRPSSRLARDNFLNFLKTLSGLLYAHKTTGILHPYYEVEEVQNAVHAAHHQMREDFTEDEDQSVDNDKAIAFHVLQDIAYPIRRDSI